MGDGTGDLSGDFTDRDTLVALETEGWQALSTGGAEATAFYGAVLAPDVVMLLPGGLRLTDRDQVLRSMAGAPWSRYELQDVTVLQPVAGTALVHYGVVAERDGAGAYSALVSSLYVRLEDGWRLAAHQQTPR